MKNKGLISLCSLLFILVGCTTFPLKVDIKKGYYRFENFKNTESQLLEYVVRGCHDQKPNTHSWQIAQQYLASKSKEEFWVQASSSQFRISGVRYTYVHLSANFEANKSYMLNRKRTEFEILIWVQEVDTGVIVSNVAKGTFKVSTSDQNKRRRKICGYAKESTF